MRDTEFGESFVGSGAEAAHVNTILGAKGGAMESAFSVALATPRQGHVGFVVVVRPGMPVRPFTLFVNKATLQGERHERLTWGAAQAGVASGVLRAVAEDVVPSDVVDDLLLIAAVYVDPQASREVDVFDNNRRATFEALRSGQLHAPHIDDLLAVADEPSNPYFTRPDRGL